VDPAAAERVRRELALPPDAPVVGFVGRLVAEKGVLELLAAARTVLDHLPTARFLFVGPLDREKPDALHPGVARDYGLAGACTFAGMRQDMPELYALMDLFVLPSHRESFPRSPMEASAMGRPCVVTAVPGCCEAVQHGRNGLLVPLGDVEALAAAILRLLAGPGEARRLGREGRRLALERFDERFVFGRVEAAYARLLAEKGLSLPAPPVGLYAAAP
jgi:glycosyltransferase involved in cell wall biosynthesis